MFGINVIQWDSYVRFFDILIEMDKKKLLFRYGFLIDAVETISDLKT